MASKLVKNATAPTPSAAAAMMATSAAWKRRSHASAACTLGSAMLGIVCVVGVPLGSAVGGAAGWMLVIGWRSPCSAVGGCPAAERDRGDGQAEAGDGDGADDGGHGGQQRGDQRDDGHDRA